MNYQPDTRAWNKKKADMEEMISSIEEIDQNADKDSLKDSIKSCFEFTPPYISAPEPQVPRPMMEMMSMPPLGKGGGVSRKAGNITISWKKMWDVTSETALNGATTYAVPWLIPFTVMNVVNKVKRAAEEKISERHALVVYVLWKNRNEKEQINEEEGYTKVTACIAENSFEPMSKGEYAKIINELEYIECIELLDGIVHFREEVQIKY